MGLSRLSILRALVTMVCGARNQGKLIAAYQVQPMSANQVVVIIRHLLVHISA